MFVAVGVVVIVAIVVRVGVAAGDVSDVDAVPCV
jgi:hypothetical protein